MEAIELGDSINPRRGTATVKLQQVCVDKTTSAHHGPRLRAGAEAFFVLERSGLSGILDIHFLIIAFL